MISDNKYKAIIFDFFGVIGSDIAGTWFRVNANRIAKKEHEAYSHIFRSLDLGDFSTEVFFDELGRESGIPSGEIARAMLEDKSINWDTVEVLKELKERYKIGLLSNANAEWLEDILGANNLHKNFDSITISSKVGFAKPDPEIFEISRGSLGVNYSETIFVDDVLHNVEAAKNLGMEGIQFLGAEDLRGKLTNLGVL